MKTVDDILAAVREAGPTAYLWVHDSGDCILWPNERASRNDDGYLAIGRRTLTPEERRALEDATG